MLIFSLWVQKGQQATELVTRMLYTSLPLLQFTGLIYLQNREQKIFSLIASGIADKTKDWNYLHIAS